MTTYPLNHRFIFVGSDSVRVDDSLLSRDRYSIDYAQGRLLLSVPIHDSARVQVSYNYLPTADLSSTYFRHLTPAESVLPLDTSHIFPGSLLPETLPSGTEELALNGAKTITASFGSGGLGLDQSLRLNVRGNIAGVKLDAILSDQSVGVTPEGTTRELAELDKVLINFAGPNLSGSVGDFDFKMDYGRLGSITRRMRGAELVLRGSGIGDHSGISNIKYQISNAPMLDARPSPPVPFAGLEAMVSYSKPKGRFGHNEFRGEDGKQGPYLLTGDVAGVTVVPGSEAVYLDGRLLVRGWDNDYTIDYTAGELTLTNRHQVTSRSRFELDFEYTTDEYDRTTLAGSAGYALSPFSLRFGAFTEGDDPNAHLAGELDSAERALLAGAGSDTDRAALPGADSVGLGRGDYVREGDHFRFVPRDSGIFSIQFSLVGSSGGDYRYDNALAGYRYVGGDSGQYVAQRIVRLPERGEAYFGSLRSAPVPGLDASFTGVLSRRTRNLFAPGGAKIGLGYDASAGWQQEHYGVKYERRILGQQFAFPGQIQERDFAYLWNLTALPKNYSRDQLSGSVKPAEPLSLDAALGWLRADSLNRKRGHLGASAWFADYSFDVVGKLTRHAAGLAPRIRLFYPQVRLRFESDTLSRTTEVAPELGFKPNENLQLTVGWQRTGQDTRDSAVTPWQGRSRLDVYRGDARIAAIRNLDLQAIAGYQRRTALTGGESDFNQVFGNLTASYSNPNGIHGRLNADQRYELTALKQEIYVRVERGKGKYSQDPETKEYYPDTLGDFVRQLIPAGPPAPSRKTLIDFSAGLTTWQWLGLDVTSGLDRQMTDTASLLDKWNAGLTLQLLPFERSFSATLADNVSSSLDQLSSYTPERDWQNQASAEIHLGGSEAVTATGRIEVATRRQTFPDGMLKSQESGLNGLIRPVVGFGLNVELRAGYGVRNFEVRQPVDFGQFQLRTLTLGARRRFEFIQKTALNADLTAERRTSDITHLPFEIALTDPLGWLEQFTLSIDRMLGSTLVLSANYTFLKRPDRATEHNFSASLKAYF